MSDDVERKLMRDDGAMPALDVHMRETLDTMIGGRDADKLRAGIAALIRASRLPPETVWPMVAAMVSAAHRDAPASIQVAVTTAEGCEVVTFHATGRVERHPARIVDAAPAVNTGGAVHDGTVTH